MTTTPLGSVSVAGGITALNPQDGLFLRAEHLRAIQMYAQDLTRTVAIGSGTGVVYGFDVSLGVAKEGTPAKEVPALKVLPGLAISPIGQSLRSSTEAVLPLAVDRLDGIGPDGFWLITVNPWSRGAGSEKAYGSLCDEPCSDSSSSIQPWLDEGVTISLVADNMPGLAQINDFRRRNWLASQYFERERQQSGPWMVPGSAGPIVAPIGSHDWTNGIGQPAPAGVPIGVVQLVNGVWNLDVWTARRDIGGPPADNAWRSRLAMRPWSVFLAEILQFQDQFSSLILSVPKDKRQDEVQALKTAQEEFMAKASASVRGSAPVKALMKTLDSVAAADVLASQGQTLWALGFEELPPAGYIGGLTSQDLESDPQLRRVLEVLFGTNVDLRICHVRADYVAGAVEEAQHLDRIPLNSPNYGKVDVDILVPDVLADLKSLRTEQYGWVAFTRQRSARCEVDLVDVYRVEGAVDDTTEAFDRGEVPVGATHLDPLRYPIDGWEYPGGTSGVSVKSGFDITLLAIATSEERRPLMALRASLFAASLDDGTAPPPVFSVVPSQMQAEAIVVIDTPND